MDIRKIEHTALRITQVAILAMLGIGGFCLGIYSAQTLINVLCR